MHPRYFKEPLGEEDKHVLTSFTEKYGVEREFVPMSDTFGIIKEKADIVR